MSPQDPDRTDIREVFAVFAEQQRFMFESALREMSSVHQRSLGVLEAAIQSLKDAQRIGGTPVAVARIEAETKLVQAEAQRMRHQSNVPVLDPRQAYAQAQALAQAQAQAQMNSRRG